MMLNKDNVAVAVVADKKVSVQYVKQMAIPLYQYKKFSDLLRIPLQQ